MFSNGWNNASIKSEDLYMTTPVRSESQPVDTNLPKNLRIRPFQLEILPPSSGVQFYRDGIIFLSYSKLDEKVPERHLSFGSVKTYASLLGDTLPGNLMPFDLTSSSLFPSEATTFSADYNTMYLSLIPDKARSEKIFKAENTSSGWRIEDEPLEICSENSIYSHPCLSENGSFMIFSSDDAGSTGGLDLWITRKNGEKWTRPENLGKQVNSAGNELFSSLDNHNNLYFSSDGHAGKGGYDIYISRFNGTGWDKPINLNGAINTKDDELAFTINRKDNNTAFYTTRTRSGKYRTQLYIIDFNRGKSAKDGQNLSETLLALADPGEESPSHNKLVPATKSQEASGEPASTLKPASTSATPEAKKETEIRTEPTPAKPTPDITKNEVVYRVQILANTKPAGSQTITVAGKNYKSFEYFYKGGYRTTIGEFSTLTEAMKLQSVCRKSGYDQAFVVAFKNNVRSTDPELFK